MKISDYITMSEAIASSTAAKKGIDNSIADVQTALRMSYVATTCFDPLREFAGGPIGVNSFYRTKKLNDAVGSTDRSHHLMGAAIDADADKYSSCKKTNAQLFAYALKNLKFTQIIWENPKDSSDTFKDCSWVHIASLAGYHRGKVTLYEKGKGYRKITAEEQEEIIRRHG